MMDYPSFDDDVTWLRAEAGSIVDDKAWEISLNESLVWIVGAGVALVLLVTGVIALRRKNHAGRATWPVYAKRLLGEREQVLYWRLTRAFPKHVVLAQVSLSQLLGVQKGTPNRQAVSNRFRQLCADFVICERHFMAVCVVELDGLSHDHPRRADADLRKTQALQSAGLTVVRVNVADLPDEAMLRALITTQ
jgi:very-short-patch-repair endonuclease